MRGGDPNLRNITRYEHGRCNAWWVRISRKVRTREQRVWSRMFSDGVHGGKEKALEAAVRWRDETMKGVPPAKRATSPRVPGRGYVRELTRSRVVRRTGAVTRFRAMVAWVQLEDGRAASTNYSIPKWGREKATEMCEAWLRRTRAALRKRLRAA